MFLVYAVFGAAWGWLCFKHAQDLLPIQVSFFFLVLIPDELIPPSVLSLWSGWIARDRNGSQLGWEAPPFSYFATVPTEFESLLPLSKRAWKEYGVDCFPNCRYVLPFGISNSALNNSLVAILDAGRNSMSFFMLLVVSLGLSVVRESLGRTMLKCQILAGLHFLFGSKCLVCPYYNLFTSHTQSSTLSAL